MYKKIIVGLSLEHGIADRALKAAGALCDDGGEIVAVHVYEPLHESVRSFVSDDDLEKVHGYAEKTLAKRVADHSNVKPVVIAGHPGRALNEYAEKTDADCIVIGSHRPGLRDFLLGSTAARIVRHAPCSVHVLR